MKNSFRQLFAILVVLVIVIVFTAAGPQLQKGSSSPGRSASSASQSSPDMMTGFSHPALDAWQATHPHVQGHREQPVQTPETSHAPHLPLLPAHETPMMLYNSVMVDEEMPVRLQLDRFLLTAPQGRVEANTHLSVKGLDAGELPDMAPWLINVTGPFAGYRLLPHTDSFPGELKLHIPYDSLKIPAGYSASDVRTYYYHEEQQKWLLVPYDSLDTGAGLVISRTDHFTDFVNAIIQTPEAPQTNAYTPTMMSDIKAADPTAGINVIAPPSANNSGSAAMQFPIEIPAGRQGMQPQLAIGYNSEGGNGWLGMGWDLMLPAITVETRWGVPRYDVNFETESYLYNGEQLLPLVHRETFKPRTTATSKGFDLRIEGSFDTIIRHGNSPSTYWWEVIDRSGTTYYYGKYADDQGVNANCILAHPQSGAIAHWALAEVKDVFGNNVKYTYQKKSDPVIKGTLFRGQQIYPAKIVYTGFDTVPGAYNVTFELTDTVMMNGSGAKRPDAHVHAKYGFRQIETQLLSAVNVYFGNMFIRRYNVKYQISPSNKVNVCAILETADSSKIALMNSYSYGPRTGCNEIYKLLDSMGPIRAHTFEYFHEYDLGFKPSVLLPHMGIQGQTHEIFNYSWPGNMIFSSLSKSHSYPHSWGGSLCFGWGVEAVDKSKSAGGSYSYSSTGTYNDVVTMDITGNGLPDRVYRKPDGYYYQPLVNQAGNIQYLPSEYKLEGLPSLGNSYSWGHSFGVEVDLPIGSGSVERSVPNTRTRSYFTDVNGDGLPDFIDDGDIYFNFLSANGVPVFTQHNMTDTVWIPGAACEYTLLTGQVNPEIFEWIDEFGYKDPYNRDVVRMWIAPYDGDIVINSKTQLIIDTSEARAKSVLVDGIRYSIQHKGDVLKCQTIHKDTSIIYHDSIVVENITRGDVVYFRLESLENRFWDKVHWDPQVFYINNSYSDVNDYEGKPILSYQASSDFLVYSKQLNAMPFQGSVRILGSIESGALSDSLYIKIEHNNSTILSNAYPDNNPVNCAVNTTLIVNEGDIINITAYTPSAIDWNKIENNLLIYYYHSDSIPVDTNSLYNKVELKPQISYNMLPNQAAYVVPDTINTSGTHYWKPVLTLTPSTNSGKVSLSVKQINKLIVRKELQILSGVLQDTAALTVNNLTPGVFYYEYTTDNPDIASAITNQQVLVDYQRSAQAGLRTIHPDSMSKLGHLYRGWGQFSWLNNSGSGTCVPILEQYLLMPKLASDTSLFDLDTTNINSMDDFENALKLDNNNDLISANFLPMTPDLKENVWRDYAQQAFISDTLMCNSPRVLEYVDTLYDDKLFSLVNGTTPGKTVRIASRAVNYALSFSLELKLESLYKTDSISALSYSLAMNTSNETDLVSLLDMNGNGYPDIVSGSNIQYTKPQGGLCSTAYKNIIPMTQGASHTNSFGIGEGLGVVLAKTRPGPPTSPVQGANSTNSTTGSPDTKCDVPKQTESDSIKNIVQTTSQGVAHIFSQGANSYYTHSETDFLLVDMNGDGLPDQIDKTTGKIALNLGYQFDTPEDWSINMISEGIAYNMSTNVGLGGKIRKSYSWSVGAAFGFLYSKNMVQIIDMDGDGLPDILFYDEGDNLLYCMRNTGTGFLSQNYHSLGNEKRIGQSIGLSGTVSGAFTINIPIGTGFRIPINPRGSIAYSINMNKSMLIDANNDGYPDILMAVTDSESKVAFSKMGKNNLLHRVKTPLGAEYFVDYELSSSTQQMPQRKWVMNSLSIYDGKPGDGKDTIYTRYRYENPYYNRFERSFMGFETVVTIQDTSAHEDGYRSVTQKFHTNDFLFSGLQHYELIADSADNKYVESFYNWVRKEIATGEIVPAGQERCFGPYYPAIASEEVLYYEGLPNHSILTRKEYKHGPFGNVIEYHNLGDTAISDDDFSAYITYKNDTITRILGLPLQIEVKQGSTLYRQRTAVYNAQGRMIQMGVFDGQNTSISEMSWDQYGNLIAMLGPENLHNQQNAINVVYDNVLHMLPVAVTDQFGLQSTTSYDHRLQQVVATTDVGGHEMQYSYYPNGRPHTVTGPKELASGAPYTILFEFSDHHASIGSTRWAKTSHYDAFDTSNRITTYTFTDGLGRVIQTKKKSVIQGIDSLVVSGKVKYDGLGRASAIYHPLAEAPGTETQINNSMSSLNPAISCYDVLDRVILSVMPNQTTQSMEYGFGHDAFGKLGFKTTMTDPKGISVINYMSVTG
jgi:hypothetical protein